jgi:hypothetical protein
MQTSLVFFWIAEVSFLLSALAFIVAFFVALKLKDRGAQAGSFQGAILIIALMVITKYIFG